MSTAADQNETGRKYRGDSAKREDGKAKMRRRRCKGEDAKVIWKGGRSDTIVEQAEWTISDTRINVNSDVSLLPFHCGGATTVSSSAMRVKRHVSAGGCRA